MLKTETTVASKVQVQPIKADSRERIGIMGGTFNPPHLGHLIMAKQVQEQLDLDTGSCRRAPSTLPSSGIRCQPPLSDNSY